MIKYSLQCDKEHGFEAWFSNSAAYEAQAEQRLISCPSCGSDRVEKALMAPNIVRKSSAQQKPASAAPQAQEPLPPPPEVVEILRKVRKLVTDNAEYVGPRFADEARKIHHEEVESRGIYGEATADEAKLLQEEGIDFLPLPILPEDHN